MKYGIRENGNTVYCANCGSIVSENGDVPHKFCKECGAPLTQTAIFEYENEIAVRDQELLDTLKAASIELNSDSLKEVLAQFEEDNE